MQGFGTSGATSTMYHMSFKAKQSLIGSQRRCHADALCSSLVDYLPFCLIIVCIILCRAAKWSWVAQLDLAEATLQGRLGGGRGTCGPTCASGLPSLSARSLWNILEIFYLGYLEYLRAVVLPPSARSLQIFDRKLLVRPLHVTSAVTIVSL